MKKLVFVTISILIGVFNHVNAINIDAQNESPKIGFIKNNGQIFDEFKNLRTDVLFYYQNKDFAVYFTSGGWSYQLTSLISDLDNNSISNRQLDRIDYHIVNPNPAVQISPYESINIPINFYSSNTEVINTYSYRKLIYKNIIEGVDIEWNIIDNQLKYNIVINNPEALKNLRINIKGAENKLITNKNKPEFQTSLGNLLLKETIPSSWQIEDKEPIDVNFEINSNYLSFKIPNLINTLFPIIIDPFVTWNNLRGSTGNERLVSVHSKGDTIVACGKTNGSGLATSGAFQTIFNGTNGNSNAFILAFNKYGSILWATYFGGTDGEEFTDIKIDNTHNIYAVGFGSSNGLATMGAHRTDKGTAFRAGILAKFNKNGNRIWSTYYGKRNNMFAYSEFFSLDIDNQGSLYASGHTYNDSDIATTGSYDVTYDGGGWNSDVFFCKFDTSGTRIWGSYYGGANADKEGQITYSPNGKLYLGFITNNNGLETFGAFKTWKTGSADPMLVKLDTNGKQRNWATYIGDNSSESRVRISADNNNNAYIVFSSGSKNNLATANTHQTTGLGNVNALIFKFNTNGTRQWSTYYGGAGLTYNETVQVSPNGNELWIAGRTTSTANISYNTSSQNTNGGGSDAYISRFNTGNGTIFSGTYLGGVNLDIIYGIAHKSNTETFVVGYTESTNGFANFSSPQTQHNGGQEMFYARVQTTVPSKTWTGNISNNWNNPNNWNPIGIPQHYDSIIIPNTITQPQVFSGDTALANVINILAGATLSINQGVARLYIGKRIIKAGTFNFHKSVLLEYHGVNGVELISDTFSKLIINTNNNVVHLNQHLFVTETLQLVTTKIALGNFNVYVDSACTLLGFDENNHFVVNGTGKLRRKLVPSSNPVSFPVGYNPYLPVDIYNFDNISRVYAVGVYENINEFANNSGNNVDNNVVLRNWRITAEGNTASNPFITLNWLNTDQTPNPNANNWNNLIRMNYGATNQQSFTPLAAQYAIPNVFNYSAGNFFNLAGNQEYSFGVSHWQNPLPVELSNLSASYLPISNNNLIEWTTAWELNNNKFIVEKSTDGVNFFPIGKVVGNGTKNTQSNYIFIDRNISSEISYYRLIQKDFDGSVEYSKVLIVRKIENNNLINTGMAVNVFPNPSTNNQVITIEVRQTDRPLSCKIYNVYGKIESQFAVHGSYSLQTKNLKKGIYFLSIENEINPIKVLIE
jgi:hypothetical protein